MSNTSSNQSQVPVKTYAIYPDYWKKSWGERPLLGYVKATDKFYAERKAYDYKLLPQNFTFGPEAVEVKRNFTKVARSNPPPSGQQQQQ